MPRSEKQPSRRKAAPAAHPLKAGAAQVGALVAAHPSLVGGVSAFAIAMSFVAANAIWYQPHAHSAPLFSTRAAEHTPTFAEAKDSATFVLDRGAAPTPGMRPEPPKRLASRDAALERVQAILKDLGYYNGEVDGVSGPNTASAITAYQRKIGLPQTGKVDKKLLTAMGVSDVTGSIPPAKTDEDLLGQAIAETSEPPAPALEAPVAKAEPKKGDEALRRIQAGLRNAGFDTVSVDGFMGKRTADAIRQFQTQNGMEPSGQADAGLYLAMQDMGLIETVKKAE